MVNNTSGKKWTMLGHYDVCNLVDVILRYLRSSRNMLLMQPINKQPTKEVKSCNNQLLKQSMETRFTIALLFINLTLLSSWKEMRCATHMPTPSGAQVSLVQQINKSEYSLGTIIKQMNTLKCTFQWKIKQFRHWSIQQTGHENLQYLAFIKIRTITT